MKKILDLHIHSPYSRACSPRLTLKNIAMAAEDKGVDIIGTGDFTHPSWFSALKKELKEIEGSGLYRLKEESSKTLFILSSEVSLIYKDGGRTRRIHLVIQAPNLQAVANLNKKLNKSYNISSDGRPILGISAPNFVRLCLNISNRFIIYPAHIWTPWYSVFGAKSGFDSLEECFQEEINNIYAYETGLSSDPAMNWRLSALDKLTCLSNSDAHSLESIGREANVMMLEKESYENIYQVIKGNKRIIAGDREGMMETIEFYPEEGKYHLDGHSLCNFSCTAQQTNDLKGLCPICHKALLIGVEHRVAELADRKSGFKPKEVVPFCKLVGLDKIIAESMSIKNRFSVKVKKIYKEVLAKYGSEIDILKDLDLKNLSLEYPKLAEGIILMRKGKLKIKAGFDGQYGEIKVFEK